MLAPLVFDLVLILILVLVKLVLVDLVLVLFGVSEIGMFILVVHVCDVAIWAQCTCAPL